ncbi:MAG: DUF536 domain-containing protein [Tissierella sp.]|uniref:DUF536 domain-containing protein n=1 Tax=Tissierella sp. TaxID=41274 RepID=UPI003F9CF80D
MKDNVYTIKKMCKELDQSRQKIRRRLEKLDIEAINEHTRTYENQPLEYDRQAFLKLAKEFNLEVSEHDCTATVQHSSTERTTNEQQRTAEKNYKDSNDKLIKVLQDQLKEANKSKSNLEKLLDQQQQLTLISNREIDMLKLELEEKKESKQWWKFWK